MRDHHLGSDHPAGRARSAPAYGRDQGCAIGCLLRRDRPGPSCGGRPAHLALAAPRGTTRKAVWGCGSGPIAHAAILVNSAMHTRGRDPVPIGTDLCGRVLASSLAPDGALPGLPNGERELANQARLGAGLLTMGWLRAGAAAGAVATGNDRRPGSATRSRSGRVVLQVAVLVPAGGRSRPWRLQQLSPKDGPSVVRFPSSSVTAPPLPVGAR